MVKQKGFHLNIFLNADLIQFFSEQNVFYLGSRFRSRGSSIGLKGCFVHADRMCFVWRMFILNFLSCKIYFFSGSVFSFHFDEYFGNFKHCILIETYNPNRRIWCLFLILKFPMKHYAFTLALAKMTCIFFMHFGAQNLLLLFHSRNGSNFPKWNTFKMFTFDGLRFKNESFHFSFFESQRHFYHVWWRQTRSGFQFQKFGLAEMEVI